MTRRRGASVVEALVALLVGLFVVHLAVTTVQRLERYRDRAGRRHDALMAARVARTVLRGELARSGRDWLVDGDSLALRAFRGTAVVCGPGPSAGQVVVAYRGDRLPEPAKDSVEVVGEEGSLEVLALGSAAATALPCPAAVAGESVQLWSLGDSVPASAVLARIFETGSYHLAGSALRYRVGAGGRQPLTPEVWLDSETGFVARDSAVRLELVLPSDRGVASEGFLTWIHR